MRDFYDVVNSRRTIRDFENEIIPYIGCVLRSLVCPRIFEEAGYMEGGIGDISGIIFVEDNIEWGKFLCVTTNLRQ